MENRQTHSQGQRDSQSERPVPRRNPQTQQSQQNQRTNPRRRRQKKNKNKGCMLAICITLAVFLIAAIVITACLESVLGMINKPSDQDREYMTEEEYMQAVREEEGLNGQDSPELDPNSIEWTDAETIGAGQDIINILLIGQDTRGAKRSRSDAMILCTLNKSTKTLTMTSFMRDMYVQIPDHQDNRINASYALGGMELLDSTLKKNFGVEIDGNIEVDFEGFEKVIDAIGGVDIELTKAEVNFLKKYGSMDRPVSSKNWKFTEGMNHLNGAQALAYARNRGTGNGDFSRTNRQRTVLNAAIEKAKNMDLNQIMKLVKEVLPLLTTDLTDSQILGFAVEAFPLLMNLNLKTQQIPAEGAFKYASMRGMHVLVPDLEMNRDILKEIMKTE